MSIPLLLWLLSTEILLLLDVMHCAPKIGGILFEPILFEAFESDEKTTTPTEKETTLPESTANTTTLYVATGSSNETIAQIDALRADVDMEYLEEKTIITSTSSSTTIPKKTTAFIAELNMETISTTLNTTSPFNLSTADQNTTSTSTQTTKKVMLYELLTPDKSKRYGRAREETTTNNVILNFLGYNFDDTICRMVDDRVLCGYNSNPKLVQPVQTVEVGNDCRLRGDRIECGYVNPPFDGIRRPPAARPKNNNRNFDPSSDGNIIRPTEENLNLPISRSTQKSNTTPSTTKETPKTVTVSPSTTKASPSTTTERTTIKKQEHCVEKGDRIICYDVKNLT